MFGGTSPGICRRWGGLEGRGRGTEVGETERWGVPVTGVAVARQGWLFEERIEADFFPDLCLDCCRIAVVCSLLVCSPFMGGEGSSTGWLPQCLRYQLTAHLGF